jgi:DNA/RNA-binding domain of Phe-tRNA-synthetase-like protein
LLDAYAAEQQATLARIGDTSLGDLPTLAAWRKTFSTFGVSPTKTRSASEALLRRLTKKGDIPSINTLVDIGNLVSIRYALPVAIFDIRSLNGALTVRFAEGDEHFTELGSDEIKHPEPGEVIFADDTGEVYARRWCWRQSIQSAARLDTGEMFVTVEAQHDEGRADIDNAVADLQTLLSEYAGGTMQEAVLSVQNTNFQAE